MLNVSEINNNNASFITYLVDSYDVWHGKLENRNYSYVKKMVNVSLITKYLWKTIKNVNYVWNLKSQKRIVKL